FDEWLDYYKSVSLISEKNVYDRMANAEDPDGVYEVPWKLRHTFYDSYGKTAVSTKGTTDNLMDYTKGTHLAEWQWDMMTAPAVFEAIFDTDEEGMAIGAFLILPVLNGE
ncbi:MAG: hypothetical protein LBM68_00555, partial [Bacteroidales bacterium]|nr:hypothetical protein [Bacteroidales bacterium]